MGVFFFFFCNLDKTHFNKLCTVWLHNTNHWINTLNPDRMENWTYLEVEHNFSSGQLHSSSPLFVVSTDGPAKDILPCLITLIPVCVCVCVCVSHTTIAGVCARSLCFSFTVVWGHSWLMAVNGTSVKASEMWTIKEPCRQKRRMTAVGAERRAFIQHLTLSFLRQCLQLKVEFNWPLHLKGHCSAYWRHPHTHTRTHGKGMQTLSNTFYFSLETARKVFSAFYFSKSQNKNSFHWIKYGGGRPREREKKKVRGNSLSKE